MLPFTPRLVSRSTGLFWHGNVRWKSIAAPQTENIWNDASSDPRTPSIASACLNCESPFPSFFPKDALTAQGETPIGEEHSVSLEPQRVCAPKPRVASSELPWVKGE